MEGLRRGIRESWEEGTGELEGARVLPLLERPWLSAVYWAGLGDFRSFEVCSVRTRCAATKAGGLVVVVVVVCISSHVDVVCATYRRACGCCRADRRPGPILACLVLPVYKKHGKEGI